jgi:hypothetical protein
MIERNVITERIGALSGLLFVALMFAGFMATGDTNPPSPDAPAAVLAADMAGSGPSQLSISLMLVSVFCFLWFLGCLRRILHQIEGDDGWLSTVMLGGGLVFAAMTLVITSIMIATRVLTDYGSDTQVAKTLYVLGWDYIYVFGPPLAVLVSATAAIILRQSVFPRWVGWMSLPFAFLLVIPPLAWPAVPLFFVWMLVVAVTLLLRSVALPRGRMAIQGT